MRGSPCYKCQDRWVSETSRCHMECKKYKEWRKEMDCENKIAAEKKEQLNDLFTVKSNSIKKNAKKKHIGEI